MEERVWHKAYAPGVPAGIEYEKVPLPQALIRTAQKYPEVNALILMGGKTKYRELNQLVDRFAASLKRLGIKKGDKVALILPNIPQIVIGVYAAWKIGAVVVMNNPLYTERELTHQLNDSESVTALCLDLLIPRILSLREKTNLKSIISCHIRDFLPLPLKLAFPFVKKQLHRPPQPGDKGVIEFMNLIKEPAPSLEADVAFDDLAEIGRAHV